MEAIDSADTTDESDIFEVEPMNELRVGHDVQLICMVKVGFYILFVLGTSKAETWQTLAYLTGQGGFWSSTKFDQNKHRIFSENLFGVFT